MNWFLSLIYGLVAGIVHFLPISSQAHLRALLFLLGKHTLDPVQSLFIHAALLLSVFTGIRPYLDQIRREQALARRRGRNLSALRTLADVRLVRNATLPMIVSSLVLSYIVKSDVSLPLISLLLIMNGAILYLPERMIQGNKDARSMSLLDSYLLALAGALSILPGISFVGTACSVSLARGADRNKALNWSFLLSIPALAVLCCLDLFQIITNFGSIHFFAGFFGNLLSGIGAYCTGYFGIILMKRFTARSTNAVFAYYSWGAALFIFLLYLTVA